MPSVGEIVRVKRIPGMFDRPVWVYVNAAPPRRGSGFEGVVLRDEGPVATRVGTCWVFYTTDIIEGVEPPDDVCANAMRLALSGKLT
jgi:hypothetical protein